MQWTVLFFPRLYKELYPGLKQLDDLAQASPTLNRPQLSERRTKGVSPAILSVFLKDCKLNKTHPFIFAKSRFQKLSLRVY